MEKGLESSNNNVNNDSIPVHSRLETTNISNAESPSDWDGFTIPPTI